MSTKQAVLVAGMAFLGGATATVVGIRVQGARAEVPGIAERLAYSGVLLQGTTPVTGSKTIRVRFFDAPVNGTPLACAPPDTVLDLTKTAGHFHINVSDCIEELEAAPNAFVEVTLDPGGTAQVFPPAGTGRPRVGAVPYAGQALRSVAVTGDVSAGQVKVTDGASVQQRLDLLAAKVVALAKNNGTFCGDTPQAFTGDLGGYAGAEAKCQAVAGCDPTTVHFCSTKEMVDTLRAGIAIPIGTRWIASGVGTLQGALNLTGQPGNESQVLDCHGRVSGSDGRIVGQAWFVDSSHSYATPEKCTLSFPVACCHAP